MGAITSSLLGIVDDEPCEACWNWRRCVSELGCWETSCGDSEDTNLVRPANMSSSFPIDGSQGAFHRTLGFPDTEDESVGILTSAWCPFSRRFQNGLISKQSLA